MFLYAFVFLDSLIFSFAKKSGKQPKYIESGTEWWVVSTTAGGYNYPDDDKFLEESCFENLENY